MLWIVVTGWALVRPLLIPRDAALSRGFGHDAAYVSIVAGNVLAGRGLVNDAHWLVHLMPDSLPVPFHNQNPLYPLAVAGAAAVTGRPVEESGFLVSAIAAGLLPLLTVLLVRPFVHSPWEALTLAVSVAVFPPLVAPSLSLLPDTLFLGLSLVFLAGLARAPSRRAAALCGLAWGLAWLTRSTAILLLPAAVGYTGFRSGWRPAARWWAVTGLTAAAVTAPWLVHNWAVWGSPFRSDSSMALLGEYLSQPLGGSVERYWHSVEPPPSLITLLLREPWPLLKFAAEGALGAVLAVGRGWTGWSPIAAVLLGGPILGALRPDWLRRPEFVAGLILAATMVLAFALRGTTVELRYVAPLSVLLMVWLASSLVRACKELRSGGPR